MIHDPLAASAISAGLGFVVKAHVFVQPIILFIVFTGAPLTPDPPHQRP